MKQSAVPTTAIRTPPTAGPTMRAALKTAELRAIALATSSLPTISTTNDWRAGMSTVLTRPSRNASTKTCQTATAWKYTSPPRTSARTPAATCVPITVLRLGQMSAMIPPKRPRTSTGRNCTTPSRPM